MDDNDNLKESLTKSEQFRTRVIRSTSAKARQRVARGERLRDAPGMRVIYRSSPEKGDRMMHVGSRVSNLGALSARGTFCLGLPGVARATRSPLATFCRASGAG